MTYVIADIHGAYDKYMKLLEKINFSDDDILYVLGDIINRGHDSIKVLRDMMGRANVIPLCGNHEFVALKALKWLSAEITEESVSAFPIEAICAINDMCHPNFRIQ